MAQIEIEVDDALAAKWRTISVKLKSEIESSINKYIEIILDQGEEIDILPFLNELRVGMKAKGLTQEILDHILKE